MYRTVDGRKVADLLVLLQTSLGSQLFCLQSSCCFQACCLLFAASLGFLDLQPATMTTIASSFSMQPGHQMKSALAGPLVRVPCSSEAHEAYSCWLLCWRDKFIEKFGQIKTFPE